MATGMLRRSRRRSRCWETRPAVSSFLVSCFKRPPARAAFFQIPKHVRPHPCLPSDRRDGRSLSSCALSSCAVVLSRSPIPASKAELSIVLSTQNRKFRFSAREGQGMAFESLAPRHRLAKPGARRGESLTASQIFHSVVLCLTSWRHRNSLRSSSGYLFSLLGARPFQKSKFNLFRDRGGQHP
jgi:hypothetical protein